jgi:predicted phage terminase large subunit-like protein
MGGVGGLGLIDFTVRTFPGYRVAGHHLKIADALERVERGEVDRLMIFMPPRHGKSQLVSVQFPAWFLGRNPDLRVIHSSYSSHLSHRFSRASRNLVSSALFGELFSGVAPARDSRAVDAWDIEGCRGGLISAGVGGSITGFGADLAIIDDPIKGASEAYSECVRESIKDWYCQDLRTRLEDGGRIVICQTRWHEDDLSGWLLNQMQVGGERWEVLHLPALSESGEALWPEKYPVDELKRLRRAVGSYAWEALYQGNPLPAGGGMLNRGWFRLCRSVDVPVLSRKVLGVDLAVSSRTSADFSVGIPVGVDGEGRYWLFRPFRAQSEWPDTRRGIIHHAVVSEVSVVGVERVAFQAAAIQELRREPELAGISVVDVASDRDKVTRCLEWSALVEQGRVYLVDDGSGWHEAFLRECEVFPRGKHDDQVDAVGIAMGALRRGVVRELSFF